MTMTEIRHIVCPRCHATNRVPGARLGDRPNCGKCGQPLFAAPPPELDAARFGKYVANNDLPVVVDFWAPWCGPCKTMAPAFERAAADLAGHACLAKLNTDSEQSVAAKYGIRSIPTLILFRGGQEIARQSGALGSADIVSWVRANTQ